MRRSGLALALALFLIAPLVAEFLLGNLSITVLPALVVLAPMYGGGALLVRESARRAGRGWPSLLLLGLAYGVVEEGLATQSLFNPDYLRLQMHLLDPAHVGFLGMGAWWTVFVLTLHTVWSVGVSIALVEALERGQPREPWLGRLGLVVAAALFVLGAIVTARFTLRGDPFVASVPKLVGAMVVAALLVAAAFVWPRWHEGREAGSVPSAWLVGALGLAAGSVFLVIPPAWGWWAVAAYVVIDAAVVVAVVAWSRRAAWGRLHELALAGGAALAYAWHAFLQQPASETRAPSLAWATRSSPWRCPPCSLSVRDARPARPPRLGEASALCHPLQFSLPCPSRLDENPRAGEVSGTRSRGRRTRP